MTPPPPSREAAPADGRDVVAEIHGNNHFLSYRLNDLYRTPLWRLYTEYVRRGTDNPEKLAHYRQCIDCFLCWLCTTPSVAVCDLKTKLNWFKE
jgi:hypothetical protein